MLLKAFIRDKLDPPRKLCKHWISFFLPFLLWKQSSRKLWYSSMKRSLWCATSSDKNDVAQTMKISNKKTRYKDIFVDCYALNSTRCINSWIIKTISSVIQSTRLRYFSSLTQVLKIWHPLLVISTRRNFSESRSFMQFLDSIWQRKGAGKIPLSLNPAQRILATFRVSHCKPNAVTPIKLLSKPHHASQFSLQNVLYSLYPQSGPRNLYVYGVWLGRLEWAACFSLHANRGGVAVKWVDERSRSFEDEGSWFSWLILGVWSFIVLAKDTQLPDERVIAGHNLFNLLSHTRHQGLWYKLRWNPLLIITTKACYPVLYGPPAEHSVGVYCNCYIPRHAYV